MIIKLKFFAILAEKTQTRTVEMDVPPETTIAQLREIVVREYPNLKAVISQCAASVNKTYAQNEVTLKEGDEVAFIPPVSGGSDVDFFEVTEEPLSVEVVTNKVINNRAGAVVTFSGIVREFTKGKRTVHLEYEAYKEMAEATLAQIGDEVKERWPEARIAISHRVGKLDISDISVVIAVATPHRPESFEAGRFAIERLKEIVPVWKKEVYEDGEHWVGSEGENS